LEEISANAASAISEFAESVRSSPFTGMGGASFATGFAQSAEQFKKKGNLVLEIGLRSSYTVTQGRRRARLRELSKNRWPQEPDLEGGCFSE
jgi:hypothetical protein